MTMQDPVRTPLYRVWGADKTVHGPLELPALATWIRQRRLQADTWVFLEDAGCWTPAGHVAELRPLFEEQATAASSTPGSVQARSSLKAENLRRIRAFAEMPHEHLEGLLGYLEVVRVTKFAHLFCQGDHGDAMYFVLEGEVRAFTIVDGKEVSLFTMGAGESFGELALLIQGPRSADVAANEDSVLLRLPAASFEKIAHELPALATPFLLTLCRTITFRSLDLGRRFERAHQRDLVLAHLQFSPSGTTSG